MVKPDPNAARRLLRGIGQSGHGGLLDEARALGQEERLKALETITTPTSSLASMEKALASLDGLDLELARVLVGERRALAAKEDAAAADQERRDRDRDGRYQAWLKRHRADTDAKVEMLVKFYDPAAGWVSDIYRQTGFLPTGHLDSFFERANRRLNPVIVAATGIEPGAVGIAWDLLMLGTPTARELAPMAVGIGRLGSPTVGTIDDGPTLELVNKLLGEVRERGLDPRTAIGGAVA